MLNAERRTPNAECRTPNAERRTPNGERPSRHGGLQAARREQTMRWGRRTYWGAAGVLGGVVLGSLVLAAQRQSAPSAGRSTPPRIWGYGGGPAQVRYSPLTQITRANVKQLAVAWTYDT